MHALIVGAPGVGKSTLIRRVLAELCRPAWGIETKKEPGMADGLPGDPVYIHEIGKPRQYTPENLAGCCRMRCLARFPEAFDRAAARLREPVPEGCVTVLDELGTLESGAEEFCAAVLALLNGDTPVIAAVKGKDTPFLNGVRSHPNTVCFHVTEENREALYPEVLAFIKAQFAQE